MLWPSWKGWCSAWRRASCRSRSRSPPSSAASRWCARSGSAWPRSSSGSRCCSSPRPGSWCSARSRTTRSSVGGRPGSHGGSGERSGGCERRARSSLLRRAFRHASSVVAALAALAPRLVRLARHGYPDRLLARRMPPPLAGLRALDLTDAPGYLCGRLLADLGVLVIKVEPPGGDAGRALAPRYRAPDGREHGLYWHATNAGKLGVTLALEHAEAPRLLSELAARADFVLDSFPPDSAAARLVAEIAAARPVLVHTSVTPFGDRPPGRALHADDVVIAATGGSMYLCGDEDRPPVRLPLWQAFCHAGAEAAVGTLLAHLARGRSGRGQHVVVSAQAAMVWTLMNAQAFPVLHGDYLRRSGPYVGSRGVRRRMVFPCADGHVSLLLMGAQGSPSTRALMGWMDEHGMLPAWLRAWPWEQWEPGWAMEASPAAQAEMVRIEG